MVLLPSHSGWSWREFIYVFVEVSPAPSAHLEQLGKTWRKRLERILFFKASDVAAATDRTLFLPPGVPLPRCGEASGHGVLCRAHCSWEEWHKTGELPAHPEAPSTHSCCHAQMKWEEGMGTPFPPGCQG